MATHSCMKHFVFSKSQGQLSTMSTAITADEQLTKRCVLTGYIQLLRASCYSCQDHSFTLTWVTGSDTGSSLSFALWFAGSQPRGSPSVDLRKWLLAQLITPGTPRFWLTVSKYLPQSDSQSWQRIKVVKQIPWVRWGFKKAGATAPESFLLLENTAAAALCVHSPSTSWP